VRSVQKAFQATHHVALSNKVGIEPTGKDLVMAQVLHEGMRGALGGDESAGSVTAIDGARFKALREGFAINETAFRASIELQRQKTDMKMIPSSEAAGRSKAFFFLSPDQHYFFKSSTDEDVYTLRKILPSYAEHIKKNPNTMLPRYVALFSVRVPLRVTVASKANADGIVEEANAPSAGEPTVVVTFVCMTYAFGGVETITKRFDMKGSTYSREASEKEKKKKSPVLKDGDWVEGGYVFPASATTEAMMAALEADTAFLARHRLIDYSLLVGIHRSENSPAVSPRHGGSNDEVNHRHVRLERTPGLFVIDHHDGVSTFTRMYVALIDILTPYSARKYAETFFLGTLRCCADISCQPPPRYARRFMDFMKLQVLSEADAASEAALASSTGPSAAGLELAMVSASLHKPNKASDDAS